MSDTQNLLSDLQSWYRAQCDGDWEHTYGIQITTMDNPGWSVIIDLTETWLEQRTFARVKRETEESWYECFVEDMQFMAYCGPDDLQIVLQIFLDWAKQVTEWLTVPPGPPDDLYERLQEQSTWDVLNQEQQKERCAAPDCERRRIQYTVFCREHHYQQIRKRRPPEDCAEVFLCGDAVALENVKAGILASVNDL